MEDIDLIDRDPNHINDYVKVSYLNIPVVLFYFKKFIIIGRTFHGLCRAEWKYFNGLVY